MFFKQLLLKSILKWQFMNTHLQRAALTYGSEWAIQNNL